MLRRKISAISVHLLISVSLALLWYPALAGYLRHDFIGKDTIFTLEPIQQLSLAVLTLTLMLGLLLLNLYQSQVLAGYLIRDASRRARLLMAGLLDMAISVSVVLCAIALAPQILYLFYRQIFPDLPMQWVAAWPDIPLMHTIVTLHPPRSLHDAMCGLLYWTTVAGVLLFWIRQYTSTMSVLNGVVIRFLILLAISAAMMTFS